MNYFQYGWPTASAKVQNFTLGPDCTAGRLLTPHAYNAIEHVFVFYSCCRRVRDFSVWPIRSEPFRSGVISVRLWNLAEIL